LGRGYPSPLPSYPLFSIIYGQICGQITENT